MGRRDVVHTAKLSLAQVDMRPRSFPPQPCSHAAPGAMREEGGWTCGGEVMDGGEGVVVKGGRAGQTEREREIDREIEEGKMKGGLLGH